MKDTTPTDWKVEIPAGGRDGYIGYYEGPHAASFYWEFGGNDIVMIIHFGKSSEWNNQYPWAVDRQRKILERLAREVIRQVAPTCKADIDEVGGYVYLREHRQVT